MRNLNIVFPPRGDSFHSAGEIARYDLPIGAYSLTDGIKPTCGIGDIDGVIGHYDMPSCFYHPKRLNAQVIWFCEGFLEYRFPIPDNADIQWIELSFEGNPQTASYHAPWKSDISVFINNARIGVWESIAERSVRRGFLTPNWWSTINTQYGELKKWRINSHGSYLDSATISDTKLADLRLYDQESICVRIGIERDAQNIGGLVLFGEKFGDYEQAITLRVGYNVKN